MFDNFLGSLTAIILILLGACLLLGVEDPLALIGATL